MNPRLLVVLGDDHQFGFDSRQRCRMEGTRRVLVGPQDAEAGPGTNLELSAGVITEHVVLAVAEKGEVVGVEPAEQLARQASLLGVAVGHCRVLQHVNGFFGPGDHLLPVLDCLLHQSQDL